MLPAYRSQVRPAMLACLGAVSTASPTANADNLTVNVDHSTANADNVQKRSISADDPIRTLGRLS